ncbi:dihydrolipoamide acetyltransferase family protein [Streptococcus ratti]|uniref:Dihydrolipoamide acetyltransferase component of pyruvate dehydrogenase complex n=1 Tax=Streptococcus ratti FA-1 = DSM 20564 TaxID=699248 RepID=A0ABN0GV02_STRRT|nr:dihydrolipoamide acetyltransferase family protein [Streptococcus ratti]EJN94113.1 branched-chain alpha-keto acid dehydrogenase subunit E2 [Streptococcus ratti FA-1 = DSM 20564]EMP68960.1 branched-chain alpha-keto acid dehydrogenase subunit E2 [Streptococcus ratti FA-1 = DSM 20564]QEY07940.1 2-oxo acid dehydrogenase subunit E2 [Streptococcus ratti]VEI60413.1 branched-chain alpha-keto acid dehydrogenase E2 subunit [Streptococcus mutans]
MATEIVMPKLGLTMSEGLINQWLVKEGDSVAAGDPVLEISSEKLTSEVEAPTAGVILKIVKGEGETVPCKQVIAWVGQEGETVPDAESTEPKPDLTAEESSSSPNQTETAEAAPAAAVKHGGGRIFITPLARKIAEERGLDISYIKGTGGNGRITRRDVEAFNPASVPAPQPAAIQAAAPVSAAYGVGLTGMRKVIAERMMNSLQTSAQLTIHRKADVTSLLAFRKDIQSKVKEPLENGEIGITTLLTKAVTKALQDHPEVNAWYANGQYQVQSEIHIGIATALSDGLVVPVIPNADKRTLSDLGRTIKEQAAQARKGTLDASLYSGSTFSITSLGGQGVEYFTPILNTPEVAILGVGTIQKALALDEEGQVVEKQYLPLSLSIDHQVLDGAPASEFLAAIVSYLEDAYSLVF